MDRPRPMPAPNIKGAPVGFTSDLVGDLLALAPEPRPARALKTVFPARYTAWEKSGAAATARLLARIAEVHPERVPHAG